MKKSLNRAKNTTSEEDEVRKRIREMVFEESKREKQELERKLNDQANAEALHEVTGVSKKKIKEITQKVRNEHSQKKEHPKKRKKSIFNFSFFFIFFMLLSTSPPLFLYLNEKIETKNIKKAKEVHKAIEEANMQLLRFLIVDKEYDINKGIKHRFSMTSPYFTDYYIRNAMREENPKMVLFLINNGALIAPDNTTRNYLTETVEKNKYNELKLPMAEAMAKQAGEGSAVKMLLNKGYPYFKTDYFRAIIDKDYEALKLFKEAQKDEFDYNWHNQGLKIAASKNYPDMLNFFFDNWSNFSERALSTAFHWMVDWKDKNATQKLIDKGASIDARYVMTWYKYRKPYYYPGVSRDVTALETALLSSNSEMVKWLISKGADINAGTFLPLNIPFELGRANGKFTEEHYKAIKLLIDNGASINKKGYLQKRPLYNAKNIQKKGIRSTWLDKAIELLENNGAIE